MSPFIEHTPTTLKNEAIERGIKPEALMLTAAGAIVLVTSWPWLGEPDEEGYSRPLIKVRLDPDDPSTNITVAYFALIKKTGEQAL